MRIVLKILAVCMVICQMAMAFNFGSYARDDNVTISGGSAVFDILLWTSESYNVSIRLYADSKPAGWNVAIIPQTLYISNNTGNELMILGGNVFRKASVIRITATPGSYAIGDYDIKIVAEAGSPSAWMASLQQRVFNLHAKLLPLTNTTVQTASQSSSYFPSHPSNRSTTTAVQAPENGKIQNASGDSGLPRNRENESLSNAPTGMLISGEATDALMLFIFAVSIIILLACAAKVLKGGF
jgi:hypothetical protein